MTNLTEPQRVTRIVRTLENQLQGDLFLKDLDHKVGRLRIERRGFGSEPGRPDALVWVEIEMHVLDVAVSLRVPILIEDESSGLSAAKEDFQKFFKQDALNLPMVVVSKKGIRRKESNESTNANVELKIHQTGFDRIDT